MNNLYCINQSRFQTKNLLPSSKRQQNIYAGTKKTTLQQSCKVV